MLVLKKSYAHFFTIMGKIKCFYNMDFRKWDYNVSTTVLIAICSYFHMTNGYPFLSSMTEALYARA